MKKLLTMMMLTAAMATPAIAGGITLETSQAPDGAYFFKVTNDGDRDMTEAMWSCNAPWGGYVLTGPVDAHSTETERVVIPRNRELGTCKLVRADLKKGNSQ